MYRIMGMIHNVPGGTWHPVVFRNAPMPGGAGLDRVKSYGHDTVGSPTQEEAKVSACTKALEAGIPFDEEFVYLWDGEGIPALVAFVVDGRLVNF